MKIEAIFINGFAALLKGLLGYGYWLAAPALLGGALILLFHHGRPVRLRLSCALTTPLVAGSLLHVFSRGTEVSSWAGLVPGLWKSGRELKSGGVISGNTAGMQGGGVYNQRGCPTYLTNCTITDNTAGAEGGAVYSDGSFGMIDATVTGNASGGEGYAVYITAAEFDGHSYSTGHKKFGGNMIIKDNQGGNLYLGEGSTVAIVNGPLGEKSYMEVTLHSGVLTNSLFGVYDYEGGDLVYTVTAGDRSLTEPEDVDWGTEDSDQQTKKAATGDIWLYAAIGIVALAVIAAVVLVIKKKAGKTAEKANKE